MNAKKIFWKHGDVFLIPLKNGKYSVGQILDLQMTNVVRCAIFNEIVTDVKSENGVNHCNQNNLISLVACSREQLDYGVWHIVGNKNIEIPLNKYPNEKFRKNGWVKSAMYDAALVEDFVNSYHALLPWNDWGNPDFLDEFLINKKIKPDNLIYIKK